MSHANPVNRLPSYLRPNLSDDAQQTLNQIDRQLPAATPAMGITRLDVPFWDVFWFAFKFFVAQAIIGAPFVVLVWYAFLR